MSLTDNIDYGPLEGLIGIWKGNKGVDLAPEPDGVENNAYYETITFETVGDVSNAETQLLAVLHYHQVVQRISDNKFIHDETGYWHWDAHSNLIMHSLTIPRGVCVLAGGQYHAHTNGTTVLEVSAGLDNKDWQIIQSPFMNENARTTAFEHKIILKGNTLKYTEKTTVDIYGKIFEHTDENELTREISD